MSPSRPPSSTSPHRVRTALVLAATLLTATTAAAGEPRPLTPEDDDRILTRVPALSPELRARARAVRSGAAAAPPDLGLALRQAREQIMLARERSDPRFIGYAQATLQPWWDLAAPPPEVLVMRAIIRQNQHDFAAALEDLDRALAARPTFAQAWMTRASLQLVRGDVAGARASCEQLVPLTSPLASEGCLASVDGSSGKAAAALARLSASIDPSPGVDAAQRRWALTLMAELSARTGDDARAERLFRDALAEGTPDGYLLAAWADFLLDHGRAAEVLPLLEPHAEADGLLLRLALAARQTGTSKDAATASYVEELERRFAASRARGDIVHLREEALFALHLRRETARALSLAQENWALQKEPIDARLLVEAARAARTPAAAAPVIQWMKDTGIEDVRLRALVAALEGGAR